MTNHWVIAFGSLTVGLVLLAVLGAVERREKFAFVGGVVLFVVGQLLVANLPRSAAIGGGIALLGILVVAASTVPLLRQSPTTS